MAEKKLTDEEIIKALETCAADKCGSECPYYLNHMDCCGDQENKMEYDILALINRQKAEIERLTEENVKLKSNSTTGD